MKFLLLLISAVFAANVCGVSAKDGWWGGVRKGLKKIWKDNKDVFIPKLLKLLLKSRSVDEMDMNRDEILDSSELSAHLDARDVDEIMSKLDTDGDGAVTKEDMKRYVSDYILQNAD